MNTIASHDGGEVYTSKVWEAVDDFIQTELCGDSTKVKPKFISMMYFIHDRVFHGSIADDLLLIESLWEVFKRVAAKYERRPTLQAFACLVGIRPDSFSRWMNGDRRGNSPEYGRTLKRMKDESEAILADALLAGEKADVSLIFAMKCAYGWKEDASPTVVRIEPETHSLDSIKRFRLSDDAINDSDEG